jgi:hypothetical protein
VCLVEIVLLLVLLLNDLQVLRVLDLLRHNVLTSKGQARKNKLCNFRYFYLRMFQVENMKNPDMDLDLDKAMQNQMPELSRLRRKTEILAQYLTMIFLFLSLVADCITNKLKYF